MPYFRCWSAAFEEQRARVESAGPVEHIGSTTVPGLAANPIIDMMAVVPGGDDRDLVTAMAGAGWAHPPTPMLASGRSATRTSLGARTISNLGERGAVWPALLAIRDHVRGFVRELGR